MKRSWWYRFTFLLVLSVISIVAVIPTVFNFNEESNFPVKSKVSLGLDLQGGLYMILGIDFNKVYRDEIKGYARKFEYVLKDEEIKMSIAYELNGKKIDYLPAAVDDQLKVKPIYKTFKGWKSSTKGIKEFEKLPENAKIYIKELEKFIETKISSISTSPERSDTILIENPF